MCLTRLARNKKAGKSVGSSNLGDVFFEDDNAVKDYVAECDETPVSALTLKNSYSTGDWLVKREKRAKDLLDEIKSDLTNLNLDVEGK